MGYRIDEETSSPRSIYLQYSTTLRSPSEESSSGAGCPIQRSNRPNESLRMLWEETSRTVGTPLPPPMARRQATLSECVRVGDYFTSRGFFTFGNSKLESQVLRKPEKGLLGYLFRVEPNVPTSPSCRLISSGKHTDPLKDSSLCNTLCIVYTLCYL